MTTFLKVDVIPNNNPPAAYEKRSIILNTSAIMFISLRRNKEYELTLYPEVLIALQNKYWKGLTTIKEIIAVIKDETVLL